MSTQTNPAPAPRPGVIQLNIREIAVLYAVYIPLFMDGGIFIRTTREYHLGDEVLVALTLPDDPAQRWPVAGRVAWVNPARVSIPRFQGIGIQFPKDEAGKRLKEKIETLLGRAQQSTKPTQTV